MMVTNSTTWAIRRIPQGFCDASSDEARPAQPLQSLLIVSGCHLTVDTKRITKNSLGVATSKTRDRARGGRSLRMRLPRTMCARWTLWVQTLHNMCGEATGRFLIFNPSMWGYKSQFLEPSLKGFNQIILARTTSGGKYLLGWSAS